MKRANYPAVEPIFQTTKSWLSRISATQDVAVVDGKNVIVSAETYGVIPSLERI